MAHLHYVLFRRLILFALVVETLTKSAKSHHKHKHDAGLAVPVDSVITNEIPFTTTTIYIPEETTPTTTQSSSTSTESTSSQTTSSTTTTESILLSTTITSADMPKTTTPLGQDEQQETTTLSNDIQAEEDSSTTTTNESTTTYLLEQDSHNTTSENVNIENATGENATGENGTSKNAIVEIAVTNTTSIAIDDVFETTPPTSELDNTHSGEQSSTQETNGVNETSFISDESNTMERTTTHNIEFERTTTTDRTAVESGTLPSTESPDVSSGVGMSDVMTTTTNLEAAPDTTENATSTDVFNLFDSMTTTTESTWSDEGRSSWVDDVTDSSVGDVEEYSTAMPAQDIPWQWYERRGTQGWLIAALLFGSLLTGTVIVLVSKRCYDSWQKRHYTKMDYLINGMYN